MLFLVELKYKAEISLKMAKICEIGLECLITNLIFSKFWFKSMFCKNRGTFCFRHFVFESLLCEG